MLTQRVRFIGVVENNGKTDSIENCYNHIINSLRKELRENGINLANMDVLVCDKLSEELLEKGFRPNDNSFYIVLEIELTNGFSKVVNVVRNWHRFYTFVSPVETLRVGNGNEIVRSDQPYTSRNPITNEPANGPVIELLDFGEVLERMFGFQETSNNKENTTKKENGGQTTKNDAIRTPFDGKAIHNPPFNKPKSEEEILGDVFAKVLFPDMPFMVHNFDRTMDKNTMRDFVDKNEQARPHMARDKAMDNTLKPEPNMGEGKAETQITQAAFQKGSEDLKDVVVKTPFEFLISILYRNITYFREENCKIVLLVANRNGENKTFDLVGACGYKRAIEIVKEARTNNAKLMLTITSKTKITDVYDDTIKDVNVNEKMSGKTICVEDIFGKTQTIKCSK